MRQLRWRPAYSYPGPVPWRDAGPSGLTLRRSRFFGAPRHLLHSPLVTALDAVQHSPAKYCLRLSIAEQLADASGEGGGFAA
jgi:hypothetical protein